MNFNFIKNKERLIEIERERAEEKRREMGYLFIYI